MKTKLPGKMQRLGPLSGSWAQSCLVLRQFLARQLLKLPLIWKWKHQKIAKRKCIKLPESLQLKTAQNQGKYLRLMLLESELAEYSVTVFPPPCFLRSQCPLLPLRGISLVGRLNLTPRIWQRGWFGSYDQ